MILIILLLIVPAISNASEEDPITKVSAFFTMVQEGKISDAYDQLFIGSNIPASKPQAVEMLKIQTNSGLPLYDSIIEFEKIREEKFGSSIIRLVYVLKSELAPTIWEFYFYKPKSDWFLANIKFNDQFQSLNSKE